MPKMKLPPERQGRVIKFSVKGFDGYVIVTEHHVCKDWGESCEVALAARDCPACANSKALPFEVFIKTGKEGSTLSGLCRIIGKLVSTALKNGVPIPAIVKTLSGESFEPSGWGYVGDSKTLCLLCSLVEPIAIILQRYMDSDCDDDADDIMCTQCGHFIQHAKNALSVQGGHLCPRCHATQPTQEDTTNG